jgi:hypothetical protein
MKEQLGWWQLATRRCESFYHSIYESALILTATVLFVYCKVKAIHQSSEVGACVRDPTQQTSKQQAQQWLYHCW